MNIRKVIIMGAAGRDFHNFNCCFRNNPHFRVVAFTAAQIPCISDRRYPASLAGRLYPNGIPVYPEDQLDDLMRRHDCDEVVFAYSDISHQELMHKASRVLAQGADFRLIGPKATMLKSTRPVVSVCAVRTGCGKSQVVRYFCQIMKRWGVQPVVVRHPMPYGRLPDQEVERFAELSDLERYRCTIEEREEYEPLIDLGVVVYAGVNYRKILARAEEEGELIIWDGGNNDFPFFRPDLEIVVLDPLRPGHETSYFPGEVNLRRADLLVINKVNSAEAWAVEAVRGGALRANPDAGVVLAESLLEVENGDLLRGKRVLVIEDGPTVTHGNMPSGAGLIAALNYGAGEIVDPRPWATGTVASMFGQYPHIGPVLPAMGYSPDQVRDLEQTIASVPCDLVLSATPMDLSRILKVEKPLLRLFYRISDDSGELASALLRFLRQQKVGGEALTGGVG